MKLIVGLGNPGNEYNKTRHNIGFMLVDDYLNIKNITGMKNAFKSEYLQSNIKGEKVFFQKPNTFMNLSGEAVIELVNYFKINVKEDLYVIYDDMDLEFGNIKIKGKSSSGGHNGIKSIIQYCGDDFTKIRFGIGKSINGSISHVLGKISKEEEDIYNENKKIIFSMIDDILDDMDIDRLMRKYNRKNR